MAILCWDGTISSAEFRLSARAFIEKWKSISSAFPPWSWIPCPKQPWMASHEVEGYLSLENIILRPIKEDHDELSCPQKEETSCSDKEESIDIATLVCLLTDGGPLEFDEIEKDLPAHSAKALLDSKWTFITQEEHPYLNRPWYKLHPCGTREWMKLLFHGHVSLGKNGVAIEPYLVSWLSVVGQVVGLRIPFEMLNSYNGFDDSLDNICT